MIPEQVDGIGEKCLKNQVLWGPTNECFDLLDQGPCGGGHWLVLRDDLRSSTVEPVCAPRPGPNDE